MLILLIIVIALIIFFVFYKKFKHLKINNVYMISGGVKTGKSALSVYLAIKTYRHNKRIYFIRKYLGYVLPMFKNDDLEPMLYSNIKLRNIKFNQLTIDIVKRKVRIPNKSVILLDEASLLADSMLFKDNQINNELMLFIKLYGHYSHGGTMIINTQAISDLHFSFKRCISNYLYIVNRTKLLGFSKFEVREMLYSDDNNIINNSDKDVDELTKPIFMFNKYYKYYDCYCYSALTDDLTYKVDYEAEILGEEDSLKQKEILSLNTAFKFLGGESNDEKEII